MSLLVDVAAGTADDTGAGLGGGGARDGGGDM
jgi:hypothetical protein